MIGDVVDHSFRFKDPETFRYGDAKIKKVFRSATVLVIMMKEFIVLLKVQVFHRAILKSTMSCGILNGSGTTHITLMV